MAHRSSPAFELRLKHWLVLSLLTFGLEFTPLTLLILSLWTQTGLPISSPGAPARQLQVLRLLSLHKPCEPIYIHTSYWFCFFREPWLIYKLTWKCVESVPIILWMVQKSGGNNLKVITWFSKEVVHVIYERLKFWDPSLFSLSSFSLIYMKRSTNIHIETILTCFFFICFVFWNYTHLLMQS